jgi:hypothetical protein
MKVSHDTIQTPTLLQTAPGPGPTTTETRRHDDDPLQHGMAAMNIPGEGAEPSASVFVIPKSVAVTLSICIISAISAVGGGAWFMATQATNAANGASQVQRFESDTNERFQKSEADTNERFQRSEADTNERFLKLNDQINGRVTDLRAEVGSRFDKDESAERATDEAINNIKLTLTHMEDQLEFLVKTASPNPPEAGVPRK